MFCHICGERLLDGAVFCSVCGTKVPNESKNKKINTSHINQKNKDNISARVKTLIEKYFSAICKKESQLLIFSRDSSIIEELSKDISRVDSNENILLAFSYMNRGLYDGFVITEKTFSYCFGGRGCDFKISEIESAEISKAGLATTMILNFSDNTISDKIFLTGIRNTLKFVSDFNDFLLELNHPQEYKKLQEQIQNKDINTLLSISCKSYVGEYLYCVIGNPIKSTHPKYEAAVNNFKVDSQKNIYIICDCTIFGTCKKGFLITEDGFYYIIKKINADTFHGMILRLQKSTKILHLI